MTGTSERLANNRTGDKQKYFNPKIRVLCNIFLFVNTSRYSTPELHRKTHSKIIYLSRHYGGSRPRQRKTSKEFGPG